MTMLQVPDGSFSEQVWAQVIFDGREPDVVLRVQAWAIQNGKLVWREFDTVQAGGQAGPLQLGPSPLWQGGGADGFAEVGHFRHNGRWRVLAETTFHVSA